jgi:hypothetical protein
MNDGTANVPSMRIYMHADVLQTLPRFSPGGARSWIDAVTSAGFEGIQFNDGTPEDISYCRSSGLGVAEAGRVNQPQEADALARRCTVVGAECATVHLGWGFEDDAEACALIEALFEASIKYGIPLYPETHRATVFQDMWRTICSTGRFPELRFNADYSHWYTGQEMVYGGLEWKWERLTPVFERIGFMHGRIGDPGAIQVEIRGADDQRSFVKHFREMWTRTFSAFLHQAEPGDYLCFTPEVLPASIFYSRMKVDERNREVEAADRWEQSLILAEIAQECFAKAQAFV